MKQVSLAVITVMIGTHLYGGEPVLQKESVSTEQSWNFNLLMEDRIFSDSTSQTLLKFQADTSLTDRLTFFSGVWLRDKLPVYVRGSHPHKEGESDYIEYADIFGGLNYTLYQYFNPYVFVEIYYDVPDPDNQWGTFAATGFSGTLYSVGKHDISYYTEWYFTLNTYDLEAGRLWSTESAVKYKYKIYEKASLYLQAVWNTDTDTEGYGLHGYSEGIYSTRLGIQVDF